MGRMPSIESDYGETSLGQRVGDESTSYTPSNDRDVTAAIALERWRDFTDSVAQKPEGVR